jgi:hypothetical protein
MLLASRWRVVAACGILVAVAPYLSAAAGYAVGVSFSVEAVDHLVPGLLVVMVACGCAVARTVDETVLDRVASYAPSRATYPWGGLLAHVAPAVLLALTGARLYIQGVRRVCSSQNDRVRI